MTLSSMLQRLEVPFFEKWNILPRLRNSDQTLYCTSRPRLGMYHLHSFPLVHLLSAFSFIQGTLPNRDDWLLERDLKTEWLQDEFFCSKDTTAQLVWSQKAVRSYNSRVEAFLERLLLLVHITSGQPARGTETLSLRHVNTMNGHHRNIFVEHGMISTVTTYHKGYTISGNTKIIHRYLPKEVGELLVYYLWMIQPLRRKLELLVLRRRDLPSPFLWAATGSLEPRNSSRLSRAMQRETKEALGVA
jgi:hypothetical protein